MRLLDEVRVAMMMLTRLPVGRITGTVPSLAAAAWAFPLVGIVVAALAWATLSGALMLGASAPLATLAALVAMVVVTGVLHEDGLADFADGIGGGRDRAQCLEIMRDSRIGSYGVAALIFMFALKSVALFELATLGAWPALLMVGVGSRTAMLALLIWLPPARADGLGQSASGVPSSALLPGVLSLGLCCIPLGWASGVILMFMALAAAAVAALAYRRIKGQTGDVLGASQSVSETFGLVVATVVLS